jgi:PleD family two-component response regulator
MPGIDGFGLAQRIRAMESIAELRLVLYSSIDDHPSREQLRNLGFAGQLSKPVRRGELLAAMDRVLSHDALEFTQRLRAVVTPTRSSRRTPRRAPGTAGRGQSDQPARGAALPRPRRLRSRLLQQWP